MAAELIASGHARGPTHLLYYLNGPRAAVTITRATSRGLLRLVVSAHDAAETKLQLGVRARARLDELERIAETIAQPWPRLDGEVPSPAEHWLAAGMLDAEVEAWLEAGVPWSTSAAQLRAVGITPRDAARELGQGWSIGLIFARDEMDLAEVQRLVVGKEGA